MAWTVANLQNQVQQHTNRAGIDAKVLGWTNRVLMELGTKAFWTRNVESFSIPGSGFTTATTSIPAQWISLTEAATRDVVAFQQVVYGTTGALVRLEMQDFYARLQGLAMNYAPGNFAFYSIPRWVSSVSGADEFQVPSVVVSPITTTATNPLTAYCLCAPDKLTQATDTYWFLSKYPLVVLAGVLRYACIYVGDLAGYLRAKGDYENGIKEMILSEETTMAATPMLRGIFPEQLMRGGF